MGTNMTIEVIDRVPTVREFHVLRESVGWHTLPERAAELGLAKSLYAVCVLWEGDVIGCGRVVGDGGVYFYIQDVIIRPQFQGRGYATRVMEKLMAYIKRTAQSGALITLMAAPGLEGFYGRFGFSCFPDDTPGMLIWK